MDERSLQERIDTLERLSGLRVIHRQSNSKATHYFQFMYGNETIKTVCTYRKARVFAEGVKAGKGICYRKQRSSGSS